MTKEVFRGSKSGSPKQSSVGDIAYTCIYKCIQMYDETIDVPLHSVYTFKKIVGETESH